MFVSARANMVIVRPPLPSETGPLAGIDIALLRQLLKPATGSSSAMPGNPERRYGRRLYVGNLPPDPSEDVIGDFFNRALIRARGVDPAYGPGNPVVSTYVNRDKRFAFVEVRSKREAAAGMRLDGIRFGDVNLRVRRPNDWKGGEDAQPPEGFDPTVLGVVGTVVDDGPDKLFIGGIPYNLGEENVKTLLRSFGELKALSLIKEVGTGVSKGFGFFEYVDGSVADAAIQGLNGMVVGDKTLTVRRASHTGGEGRTRMSMMGGLGGGKTWKVEQLLIQETRIVRLNGVVEEGEEDDVQDVMHEEARRFGHVDRTVIKGRHVWIEYTDVQGSRRAQIAFNGRRFGERVADASFVKEIGDAS